MAPCCLVFISFTPLRCLLFLFLCDVTGYHAPPSSLSDAVESSAAKPDKQMTPRKAALQDKLNIIQKKYSEKDTPRKKKKERVAFKQKRAIAGYMARKLHKRHISNADNP